MNAVVAAERHGPGGAAHLIVLVGVVLAVVVVIGVSRWRRRDAAATAERPTSNHPVDSHRSEEDE